LFFGKAESKFSLAILAASGEGSKNELTQSGKIFFMWGPNFLLSRLMKAEKV
jgi:hypothetical protein